MTKPKYAIINDTDAPQPSVVVQWGPTVGYCYLDRTKSSFDGMRGYEATDIEDFGFRWAENPDGTVSFYMSDIPSTATYRDGKPRAWQSPVKSFERRVLTKKVVVEKGPINATP